MRKNQFERHFLVFCCLAACFFTRLVPACAEPARDVAFAARGTSKLVQGAIAIPKDMIEDSKRFVFPVGILTGAARGAFQTVAYTVSGTLDAARAAAPYAKYLLFL